MSQWIDVHTTDRRGWGECVCVILVTVECGKWEVRWPINQETCGCWVMSVRFHAVCMIWCFESSSLRNTLHTIRSTNFKCTTHIWKTSTQSWYRTFPSPPRVPCCSVPFPYPLVSFQRIREKQPLVFFQLTSPGFYVIGMIESFGVCLLSSLA